jgi:hypothetical protein
VRLVVLTALVALAIAATIQLTRGRAFSLHVAPLLVAIVLLLSAVGPWSALAISQRSQQERLAAALSQVGDAVPAGSSRVVPAAAYVQLRESARYLAAHFGRDALPAGLAAFAGQQPGRVDYAARLGLRPDSVLAREGQVIGGALSRTTPLEINGGTAYRVTWTRSPRGEDAAQGVAAPDDRSPVRVVLREGLRLEFTIGGRLLSGDLGALMHELERTADPGGPDQLPAKHALVPLADAAGQRAGDLVIWDLRAQADATGWQLQRVEGLAVVSARL